MIHPSSTHKAQCPLWNIVILRTMYLEVARQEHMVVNLLTYGINIKPSSSASKDTFCTTVLRWRKARVVLGCLGNTLWNHHNPAGTVKPLIHSAGIFIDIFFSPLKMFSIMLPAWFKSLRKRYIASHQTNRITDWAIRAPVNKLNKIILKIFYFSMGKANTMQYFIWAPPHGKTNKMACVHLGIRPVWSESLLCAQWVAKYPNFLHADSEDSDQTGQMPGWSESLLGTHATSLVLSWCGSFGYFQLVWSSVTVYLLQY